MKYIFLNHCFVMLHIYIGRLFLENASKGILEEDEKCNNSWVSEVEIIMDLFTLYVLLYIDY